MYTTGAPTTEAFPVGWHGMGEGRLAHEPERVDEA